MVGAVSIEPSIEKFPVRSSVASEPVEPTGYLHSRLPVLHSPVPWSAQSENGSSNELGQVSSPEISVNVTLVGSTGQLAPDPLDEPLPRPLDEPPDPLDELPPEASEGSPPDPLDDPGGGSELPLEQAVLPSKGTARAAPAVVDQSS
jgi:hypothetical protein